MRIAMVGRDLPDSVTSGGVAGQIDLLAGALARSGHQVTAYALNAPVEGRGYGFRPIPVPPAIMKRRWAALYTAPWWVSHLPLDHFDVVHAHGEDQFIRTRRPLVRTFYGSERAEARYSTTLRRRLYHLSMVPLEWLSERRATALVSISRSSQRYLARESVVIPCGYEPTAFFPGGAKSPRPSILFVGELGTRKRAELLLETFAAEVRPAIPEAELWMVTSGTVRVPGVRSFARVPTTDLADLYRSAWVYCMPSRYEGFGVPYVEAMACGTPVVATANGGAEEVLDRGRAGSIVMEKELGRELIRLLGDNSARDALAARGLLRAKEYEISRVAEQYLALYRSLSQNDLPSTASC